MLRAESLRFPRSTGRGNVKSSGSPSERMFHRYMRVRRARGLSCATRWNHHTSFARLGGGGEIERAQNRGIVGRPSYLDAISDVDHVPAILRDDENRRASVARLRPQDLHKSLHGGSPACCGRGSCGPSVCGRGPHPFLTASPLSLARTLFLGTISPPLSLCPPLVLPFSHHPHGGYFRLSR